MDPDCKIYDYDGAMADLDDALKHLIALLVRPDIGRGPVAWWVCANYPRDVLRAPMYREVRALAEAYKDPPRGTWEQWFSRDAVVQ